MPVDVLPLHAHSLTDVSAMLERGEVTSVEVVVSVLHRAEQTQAVYAPYVHIDAEHALEQARASDARRAAGRALSPIDGIPFGIKDILRTQDLPTGGGRHPGSTWEAERSDDVVVASLRATGAVIMGKHATHHFASGVCLSGARNVFDPRYFGGGSSAGAGVSVALGSSLGAIGTDSGGSVRIPAAFNGVVGFIPSRGDMPDGEMWGANTFGTSGLICRTVADVLLTYPLMVDGPRPAAALPEADPARPLTGLRVGVVPQLATGATEHIDAVVQQALARLEQAGATLVAGEIDGLDEIDDLFRTTSRWESRANNISIVDVHKDLACTATLERHRQPPTVTADDYARVTARRAEVGANVVAFVTDNNVDVLIAPTTGTSPVPVEGMQVLEEVGVQTKFSLFANILGYPAITMPAGWEDTGISIGVQFMGISGTDMRVLQWAQRAEQVLAP